MRLLPVLIACALFACGGPPYTRLSPADPAAPGYAADAPMVWLVVVDGLRAETLQRYLDALHAEDWEPRWPSAITRLRARRKAVVRLRNAASALETGSGALATLLTGTRAARHHRPAAAWIDRAPDAPRRALGGLTIAQNSALRIDRYFEQRAATPTIFEALPHVRSVAIHLPFGPTPQTLVPRDPDAFAAWIDGPGADYSGPVVDRIARDAAIAQLHSAAPPNLLALGLRGVFGADDQVAALRIIDGQLADLLAALDRAHPAAAKQLSVLLVGHSPVTELGPRPRHLSADAIRARLLERAPDCAVPLAQLRVVPNGRTARLYLPETRRAHGCLATALAGLRLYQAGWLDGAAWRAAAGPEVLIVDRAAAQLGESRVRRLTERLANALGRRQGDALLFAAPAITFGGEDERAVGGVSASALDAAQLWISDRLDPRAAQAIAAAPLEATALAPTLVALLARSPVAGGTPALQSDRPPVLAVTTAGQWRYVPAARLDLADAADQPDAVRAAPPLTTPTLAGAVTCAGLTGSVEWPAGVARVGAFWDTRLAQPGTRYARLFTAAAADARPPQPARPLAIPLDQLSAGLEAVREAHRLGVRRERAELLARFGDALADQTPKDAFLALLACDAFDRCHTRPLISDRDFDALRSACP